MITSEENPSSYNEAPFHGIEGERLIFKWTPIKELNEVALYPECLRDRFKRYAAVYTTFCSEIIVVSNLYFNQMDYSSRT